MNITSTINAITGAPRLHAEFLNGLAYLEYRGFRKIVRARSTEEMTYAVLTHAAEEVRHALFFKRQAVKLGGLEFNDFAPTNTLAFAALKAYFYQIDARVARVAAASGNAKLKDAIYYLVTWLVETRATSVYEVYEKILRKGGHGFSLNGILREETQHLEELGEEAKRVLVTEGFDPKQILLIESEEFSKLWTAIANAVATPSVEIHA